MPDAIIGMGLELIGFLLLVYELVRSIQTEQKLLCDRVIEGAIQKARQYNEAKFEFAALNTPDHSDYAAGQDFLDKIANAIYLSFEREGMLGGKTRSQIKQDVVNRLCFSSLSLHSLPMETSLLPNYESSLSEEFSLIRRISPRMRWVICGLSFVSIGVLLQIFGHGGSNSLENLLIEIAH